MGANSKLKLISSVFFTFTTMTYPNNLQIDHKDIFLDFLIFNLIKMDTWLLQYEKIHTIVTNMISIKIDQEEKKENNRTYLKMWWADLMTLMIKKRNKERKWKLQLICKNKFISFSNKLNSLLFWN